MELRELHLVADDHRLGLDVPPAQAGKLGGGQRFPLAANQLVGTIEAAGHLQAAVGDGRAIDRDQRRD
ncbi:MAG TPA: hypothetical protein PKN11_00385, partial [Anaerolineaceae bacterium]|nr:hypothetical protein [Anaerolineaceae bacterium]